MVELGPEIFHGQWSEAEALLSSTWWELKAVYLVLMSFAEKLAGHRVKWFTDNQGVMFIIRSGSKREHLQEGALEIHNVCLTHNIKLEIEWVPRSANEYADVISRVVDYDDWKLDPDLFIFLDAMWGPHTVDCFAAPENKQVPRYHSRFWSPGSEAVDTFTVNWAEEVNWWVPPLYLVCRTISHASNCKAKGTLIVSMWKSSPFWPILCPDGEHLAPFVHAWWSASAYPDMFQRGHSGSSLGDTLNADSWVLALFIDLSIRPRPNNLGFQLC